MLILKYEIQHLKVNKVKSKNNNKLDYNYIILP